MSTLSAMIIWHYAETLQMKLIKTHIQSYLSDTSPSHLMKIAIEPPDKLKDDLEDIVDAWNRKDRIITVWLYHNTLYICYFVVLSYIITNH